MNLWTNLLINKGDLITEIEALVLPLSRQNLQNELGFRNYLISNFGILPCFIRRDLYFFRITPRADIDGFKEVINTELDKYLVSGVIIFQPLRERKLIVNEKHWMSAIPFVLDYSFRKGVEENSKVLVRFSQRRKTTGGRRITERVMYLSNPKEVDPQLDIRLHEGFEYRFIRAEENNFCVSLEYKLYNPNHPSASLSDRNIFLINSSERRNLSEELLHKIFPESGINLTLGNLDFLLIPKFHEQGIELVEEGV